MRIALVIARYDARGGGAERWTDRHAKRLIDAGHEVHLVSTSFADAPDAAICHPVSATQPRRRLSFARASERALRSIDADVVHDMGDGWRSDVLMPHHGTRKMNYRVNSRFLHPLHRLLRPFAYYVLPRYREFQALERRQFAERNTLIVAVSGMIRDHLRTLYGVDEQRVRVIHNGVDVASFNATPDGRERDALRKKIGVRDETLFLLVAHNFKLKGLDALLRAMAELKRRGANARLLVVGDGQIHQYRRLAVAMGCEELVHFTGAAPEALPYYHAADVFVMPTHYDPCSLVAMEAMSCGLPTITTRCNGIHELMHNGREGAVLDDPDDVASLTAHMQDLLDPAVRRERGAAARALAEAHDTEKCFAQHLAVYDEVVTRRKGQRRGSAAQ